MYTPLPCLKKANKCISCYEVASMAGKLMDQSF